MFLESGGWERPHWYEANAGLLQQLPPKWAPPARDAWSGQFHSPIAAAEAWRTRTSVAMYDMTPLKRLEIAGRGALRLLQRLTTGKMDKSVGSVTYTLLLDEAGGVRSDLTVARLAENHFQVGANGNIDLDYFCRQASADDSVQVRSVTALAMLHRPVGSACTRRGPGPQPRRLLERELQILPHETCTDRWCSGHGHAAVVCRRTGMGALHERRVRAAPLGCAVAEGQKHDVIAAGGSLQQPAHREGLSLVGDGHDDRTQPYEAGLGFAVSAKKTGFVGHEALQGISPSTIERRLATVVIDDGVSVVMKRARPPRRQASGLCHQRGFRPHRWCAGGLRLAAAPPQPKAPGSRSSTSTGVSRPPWQPNRWSTPRDEADQSLAAAVETELPRRDDAVDAGAHSTTTERSTSPRCMVANASSTWSSLTRSLTNFSNGRRPCW